MDRDENAAKNICTVGSTGTTPMEFQPLLTKYREQVGTLK